MFQHIAKTVGGLVEDLRRQPDTANVSFSTFRIRQFTLPSDEPSTFGGVDVKVKSHPDLRGFLNVVSNVRSGFTGIEYTTTIEAPTATEPIDQLETLAGTKCPMLYILQTSIPVSCPFEHLQLRLEDVV